MTFQADSSSLQCVMCRDKRTSNLIGASVGSQGKNVKADVRTVQELLNSLSPSDGGPALFLAEDGICGPKTQAAINKFQAKVLPRPDGRIDVGGRSITQMAKLICDSVIIQPGPLGLAGRPGAIAGSPNTGPIPTTEEGELIKAVAKISLKVLEPRLQALRSKLTHTTPLMHSFINKHFATGKDKVNDLEIVHIQKILSGTHFQVARANSFGSLPIDNVIQFDPKPFHPDLLGWTAFGGDKLSTSQFDVYTVSENSNKTYKAPGQSIFLTRLFGTVPSFEKHWIVLHEVAHFVGARVNSPNLIDDHAYAKKSNFLTLSKNQKLHNAESLALFFLEWCVGTENILTLPRLAQHKTHFEKAPRVAAFGDLIPIKP